MSDLDTINGLVKERDDAVEAKKEAESENSTLHARVSSLQSELTRHQQRSGDLDHAQAEVRRLKQRLEVAEHDHRAERLVRERLEHDLDICHEQFPKARDEFKGLADSAERRMEQLADAYSEVERRRDDLQREVDRLRKIETAAAEDLKTRDALRDALGR